MKLNDYPHLQETLYTEKLSNGLQLCVLPKPGFHKTYATFTTRYGSIDQHFQVEGEDAIRVPDGIAHFLEHKMFEEPSGDVFATFASQGASANAFTSFDRTSYLFSATEQIDSNIQTLLDFVQHPYFTDQNVEKEKGIIAEEIRMYQDHPDFRVYFGLIEALYEKHPVHIDIAGTIESIQQINKELLYTCYHTFYHPSNMLFFIVGDVEPNHIAELVKSNQDKKTYAQGRKIHRLFDKEPNHVRTDWATRKLSVSIPKCLFGFKDVTVPESGTELIQREVEMKVLLDVLFSASSALFETLYNEDMITDQFSHEYNTGAGYAFSVIGGETKNPKQLISRVKQELERIMQQGISEQDFERSRRKKMGSYLRMLNSPEAIAGSFTKYHFKQVDFFKILHYYEQLTLDCVQKRMREHIRWESFAVSVVTSES